MNYLKGKGRQEAAPEYRLHHKKSFCEMTRDPKIKARHALACKPSNCALRLPRSGWPVRSLHLRIATIEVVRGCATNDSDGARLKTFQPGIAEEKPVGETGSLTDIALGCLFDNDVSDVLIL